MTNTFENTETQYYLYFAYGSNMSLARLLQRVPSAQKYCQARLYQHQLRFHKRSHVDGSTKCDAWFSGKSSDWLEGIVYLMDKKDRANLDKVEGAGHGYKIKQVSVLDQLGKAYEAYTYIATDIDTSLKPFDWYKHHVLTGANENALPAEYIKQIAMVEVIADTDTERFKREMAIYG